MEDDDYPHKAKERVENLIRGLTALQAKDPEQEVGGIALPVLDAVIETIKDDIGRDNPVVAAVAGIISPETIELGEPIRAADALLVATMLDAELGDVPWVMPGIA